MLNGKARIHSHTKEALLSILLILLNALAIADKLLKEGYATLVLGKEARTVEVDKRVETACIGHILQTLTVYNSVVYTLHKVVNRLISAILLSLLNNALRCRLANALDGCQAKANIALLVGRELHLRLIDIGAKHRNTHTLALGHIGRNLLNIIKVTAQYRCHILRWIVRLDIGCLVGNPRITSGVRLIEGVRSKLLPVGPNLLQHLLIVAIGLTTSDKLGFKLVKLRLNLLTHRLTQGIRLASCEVTQQSREKHHLLLIDRNTIGILQISLHNGDIVDDRFAPVLTVDKVGNIVHRARSIESIHRNQILECRGLQLS